MLTDDEYLLTLVLRKLIERFINIKIIIKKWGIGRKKNYPALFCCYHQTRPAQFGQNHPPSSFSPHQAIIATKQSWVIFFSANAPL